jgi:UDP-2,4-diacetamido-2,4,6-trideoxy-beta-L-altropyranose hydrolase
MMRIAIRVDAAERIGSGHVTRCLTLANRLARAGARVRFVCREITPDLAAAIARGHHELRTLPACRRENSAAPAAEPPHAAFLDCDWQQDALDTLAALADVA